MLLKNLLARIGTVFVGIATTLWLFCVILESLEIMTFSADHPTWSYVALRKNEGSVQIIAPEDHYSRKHTADQNRGYIRPCVILESLEIMTFSADHPT
ncbi:MAG: hypothetical protein AAF135_08385, partial [Bacteroidota bacterium]